MNYLPFRIPFRSSVHLTQQEAHDVMRRILTGEMATEGIAELLNYLRKKGETVQEIVGFAQAIRDAAHTAYVDQSMEPVLDTCGTGGDGTDTFNISTATAFVVAGAGQRVAKHGNRRITSRCGSADVLEALGIRIDLTAEQAVDCVRSIGIGFLFAPGLHPAVRHSREARLMVKGRTVFNMLGPLTNPVGAKLQIMGAYSVKAAELMAHAAARLGTERAFVVHGADGLDEITTTAQTTVFQVEEGRVQKGSWGPSDFGVARASLEDLKGGEPERNADLILGLLQGEQTAKRDIVVANAAAALLVSQRAGDLKSAVGMAADSIDTGKARQKLVQLVELTNRLKASPAAEVEAV